MTAVKAAVMTGPGAMEMREFPRPAIGADEILLKVERTGICGSDKHMYAGHMPLQFPVVPGHELVGVIEELGPQAAGEMAVIGGPVAEGDLVTTTPSSQACGRCWYCLHQPQRPALCANRYVHGFVSSDVAPAPRGGFAEYMHLTPRSWIFRIPEGLSPEMAVLTEPAAVATRAVERALAPGIPHISEGLGMDKSVMVLGAGPIGQLAIAALAHVGTDCIIASDLSASRLTLAEAMGAHHAIAADASLDERLEQVQELTGGVEIRPNQVCFKDLDIRGMWAYPAMQFKTALSFLKSTRAPLDRFITHTLGLDETEEGIEVTGTEGSMKVVVVP